MPHTSVKMSYVTTQFPGLPFCGPHAKPHGVIGLSKHYHLRIDPKWCKWYMYNTKNKLFLYSMHNHDKNPCDYSVNPNKQPR